MIPSLWTFHLERDMFCLRVFGIDRQKIRKRPAKLEITQGLADNNC